MMMNKVLFALLTISITAIGQNFSETTNTLRLNMTEPVVGTTLPTITWITPRTERTNSVDRTVVFEAEILSDVPLKAVWLELTTSDRTAPKQFTVTENQYSIKVKQSAGLLDGENTLRLFAQNVKGGLVSSVRAVITGKDALEDAIDINRKDLALIFVTDVYDHLDDLVNPVFDGRT